MTIHTTMAPGITPHGTSGPAPSRTPQPLRRKRIPVAPRSAFRRKAIHFLLVFVTVVLVVDALVGEKGLTESIRARRHEAEQEAAVARLRQENAELREQARRLREDPSAIESVAREQLGLIRPGETLFILKDVKPAGRAK
jgi:cell division protein FtsB